MIGGRHFRAGLVQLRAGRTIDPNLDQAEALIRQAAKGGADYVQTPENTALMELDPQRVLALVQPESGSEPLARLTALAAELGIWLHVGSLGIKLGEDRVANRSYVIDPHGAIVARYDKLHMFDVDLPGGESYRESEYYGPGEKAVVVDLPSPPRSPSRRARRIGMCCSGRVPSRLGPTCSPPRKAVCTRTAATRSATA